MNIGYPYDQNSLMSKIRLTIDFTRLAKIAYEMNKLKVAEYLI